MRTAAIIWDYDGTLIDSARKNMAVAVEVLRHFDSGIDGHLPEALKSYEAYQRANYKYKNWRELYVEEYGVRPDQLDEAGALWMPEQMKNKTVPELFPGIAQLVRSLDGIKMGICSQNGGKNIRSTLSLYDIDGCFDAIVGHDDIPWDRQKPDPCGFIECVKQLAPPSGAYVYIGDHSEDVTFGRAAQEALGVPVICVAVDHLGLPGGGAGDWKTPPDFYARGTAELSEILHKLADS